MTNKPHRRKATSLRANFLYNHHPNFEKLESRLVLDGQGFDSPGQEYEMGHGAVYLTAADIDGDGHIDIMSANEWSNTVSVLRNLGDGTFADQVAYPTECRPQSITAADVDGDGHVDLISANVGPFGTGNISVLRNLGNGTFTSLATYNIAGVPSSVNAADVDGDGLVDIIALSWTAGRISVLRNLGDGIFTEQMTYTVGKLPHSLFIADTDGDGHVDLITANSDSETVSVLRNQGDGTFANQATFAVENMPYSVAAADIDGDSHLDLVVASTGGSGSVSVLRNQGDGTFANHATYAVGLWPRSVTVADLDGDGYNDIIVANIGSAAVSVLRNLGDGTFADQITFSTGSGTSLVVAVDVNGDGLIDLAAVSQSSDTIEVLQNLGNGTFADHFTYAVGHTPYFVTSADIDGDGHFDLITANYWTNRVSILRNLGDGTFADQVTYAVGNNPNSVTVADVDGDGHFDLITTNIFSDSVSVLRNLGNGVFADQVTYAVESFPYSAAAADVDGDGHIDLVVANRESRSLSVLRNLGDGTFAEQVAYDVGGAPYSVTSADLDGDGFVDLIATDWNPGAVSVLWNLGNGTFADLVFYTVEGLPHSVKAADVDNDGLLDLLTANLDSNTVSVLRNLGERIFSDHISYSVEDGPWSMAVADVNGDGYVDLITANFWSDGVSVLRNEGNGTFARQMTYAVGRAPKSVVAADVNGDGYIDLMTANQASSSISVLLNLGTFENFIPPVARPDGTSTNKNTAVTINVLSNDSDPDGTIDPTTVTIVDDATYGIVEVNPITGLVTYTPVGDYIGFDSFTYQVQDYQGNLSNVATIDIEVIAIYQPPVAVNDSVWTSQNTPVAIDVLANDVAGDWDIDPTTVTIIGPTYDQIDVDPLTGIVTFTPPATGFGHLIVSYRVRDIAGNESNTAQISFRVNVPPFAAKDSLQAIAGTSLVIDVLANDLDGDNGIDPTSVVLTAAPTQGSISINPFTGVMVYWASPDATGSDSFRYRVRDNFGELSNEAVVTIEFIVVNTDNSISGVVYLDHNNNARPDDELGIADVVVRLIGPVWRETTTLSDGSYRFDNLPDGTYTVIQVQPQQYSDGMDSREITGSGTIHNDRFSDIAVTGGVHSGGYKFGERETIQRIPLTKEEMQEMLELVRDVLELDMPDALVIEMMLEDKLGPPSNWDGPVTLYDTNMQLLATSNNLRVIASAIETDKDYFVGVTLVSNMIGTGSTKEYYDVNRDGIVSPADLLIVIDYINRQTASQTNVFEMPPDWWLDMSGDGIISPADIILLIDELNRNSSFQTNLAGFHEKMPAPIPASNRHHLATDIAFGLLQQEQQQELQTKSSRTASQAAPWGTW
jgi:hypothetical protein